MELAAPPERPFVDFNGFGGALTPAKYVRFIELDPEQSARYISPSANGRSLSVGCKLGGYARLFNLHTDIEEQGYACGIQLVAECGSFAETGRQRVHVGYNGLRYLGTLVD